MENGYSPTIGLEVHAELKTLSKMFCACRNNPDEKEPNLNICHICTGQPGALPTINREAVRSVLLIGTALQSRLADFTEFDRKHYFYPDIPKGYQISQYAYPLVSGGSLSNVEITRIHLEEDTAKSLHGDKDKSQIDFNRSGVPLMELVTEPVIKSGKQAAQFARELQLLIRFLGIGSANMEKGEMRVEANLSLSLDKTLGTKVEIKNLNSFRSMEKAIDFEINRQTKILSEGGEIKQETLGWDEVKQVTVSRRDKEESHDYRYFPEPDLPPLKISEIPEFKINRESLPELPWEVRKRYIDDLGISEIQVDVFLDQPELTKFFEDTIKLLPKDIKDGVQKSANYITSDVVGILKELNSEKVPFTPQNFAELITMITKAELSSRGAKDVLLLMLKSDESPRTLAENNNLIQASNKEEMSFLVKEIISENPEVVEDYRKGKESALQFLIGQGMKKSKGSANPQVLKKLFENTI